MWFSHLTSSHGTIDIEHGIRENVTWNAKMHKSHFLEYKEGRLELVFAGNFCQLQIISFEELNLIFYN
jgi:hypothetical protein